MHKRIHNKIRRTQTVHHLNRIQGQLETLRRYIIEERPCNDITQLACSIAKSFDALRARTLEGFIINELLEGKKLSPAKTQKLSHMLNLHKK